ncbi:GntR family transcriptional regulator [Longispora sp. K20-0274]|uniref:FadR/GntR family transcriptional regulator n=1 Tax=Longispora sp. K20-0274 TaxID=3088255 RepID=UPI00399A64DE
MDLRPVSRSSVPDSVFDQLVGQVVAGGVLPGDALPAERRLAELFGVSRPAVREALQRLSQVGLVEVRQGGATTVRDFRRHGGLGLLPRLLVRDGRLDAATLRGILEARLTIGSAVAGLAARRDGEACGAALREVATAMAEACDVVGRQARSLDFWDHIVDAADSIAFRLMFNDLRAIYEPALEALAAVMAAEVDRIDLHRALAAAIAAADADAASAAAVDLLEPATAEILTILDQLEE